MPDTKELTDEEYDEINALYLRAPRWIRKSVDGFQKQWVKTDDPAWMRKGLAVLRACESRNLLNPPNNWQRP